MALSLRAVSVDQPGRAATSVAATPYAASPSRMTCGSAAISFSCGISQLVELPVVSGSAPASAIIELTNESSATP